MLTGLSMSPAFTARFTWYPRLPGNRQVSRSIHFLLMCAFVVFLIGHVTMVVLTGLVRNMNHIVVGSDNTNLIGLYVGLAGGVVVLLNAFAVLLGLAHLKPCVLCNPHTSEQGSYGILFAP